MPSSKRTFWKKSRVIEKEMSLNYSTRREFNGDEPLAFETIQSILLSNGFRLIESTQRAMKLKGRGMQSTKENPLRGATEISVDIREGELLLSARLGGVRFMVFFVMLFPLAMFGFFALAPYIAGGWEADIQQGEPWYGLVAWLVLSPLLSLWIRKRTVTALDDLLENAVVRAARK